MSTFPLGSESPHPDAHPIEQGNPSPSTSALMREYEWDAHTDEVEITKAPIVQGTMPHSRHPFPHDPLDYRGG